MQSKVKIFLRNGQSFIAPESNLANIRRMYDRDIESIEYSNAPQTTKPAVVEAEKRLENINATKDTVEVVVDTERHIKLIEAGFTLDQDSDVWQKGDKIVTVEQVKAMLPMQFGKLLKTKTN